MPCNIWCPLWDYSEVSGETNRFPHVDFITRVTREWHLRSQKQPWIPWVYCSTKSVQASERNWMTTTPNWTKSLPAGLNTSYLGSLPRVPTKIWILQFLLIIEFRYSKPAFWIFEFDFQSNVLIACSLVYQNHFLYLRSKLTELLDNPCVYTWWEHNLTVSDVPTCRPDCYIISPPTEETSYLCRTDNIAYIRW